MSDKSKALFYAIRDYGGGLDGVRNLLERYHRDPEDRHQGWSPLYIAIHNDRPDVAALLLEFGADPKAPCGIESNRDGFNILPLEIALEKSPGSIPHLVRAGVDLHQPLGPGKKTPIEMATDRNLLKSIAVLLELGVAPGPLDKQALLQNAVNRDRPDLVRELVRLGVGVDPALLETALEKSPKSLEHLKDHLDPSWKIVGKDKIRRLELIDTKPLRSATDIFNFAVRERLTIVTHHEIKSENVLRENFDASANNPLLHEAFEQFTKLGGKADPAVLKKNYIARNKESLIRPLSREA